MPASVYQCASCSNAWDGEMEHLYATGQLARPFEPSHNYLSHDCTEPEKCSCFRCTHAALATRDCKIKYCGIHLDSEV